MKVLFVSNLFPDSTEPNRGLYNARLVHSLSKGCELRVLSPRPALPLLGNTPRKPRPEDVNLKPVFPPARYIPKIGSRFNHRLMAGSLRKPIQSLRQEFAFDVVLASWLYPDACGISILAQEMDFPFVAVCQGSDAHQYLRNPNRRRAIVESMASAARVATRSRELARLLEDAGIANANLQTIYNGVDTELFHPIDKQAAREALQLPLHDRIVLFVGNFYSVKNPSLLAKAFAKLRHDEPDAKYRLIMIGDGPEREAIIRSFIGTGYEQGTRFPGRQPAETVARYMQAADVLCVPSDNEGVPNVILEAFASGLKVVATNVGGIPEILNDEQLGTLVSANDAETMATALRDELNRSVAAEAIADHAAQFTWQRTADAYLRVLQEAASSRSD